MVFDENDGQVFEKAKDLRSEYVIAAEGKVRKRDGAVNEELATGDIEVTVDRLTILSESETPPFPVEDDVNTREELRLQYRYLDLRRPKMCIRDRMMWQSDFPNAVVRCREMKS